jgi:hypothetical protein
MNWLWAYFRRKTRDALLAGINDALAAGGGTGLSDEQAAGAVLGLIGPAGPGGDTTPPQQPPQLAGSDPAAVADSPKRGPGRPRKFQEPPE